MSGSERGRPGFNGAGSARNGKPESAGSTQNGKSKRQTKTAAIVPIYERLPKGPHSIGATGVARNQRIRMYGGMIEAVATRGYARTSVRLVIGLAGVSRRVFYEQFSGKEECFLATFDLIIKRVIQRLTTAYRSAPGDPEQRVRVALEVLGAELEQNPKALHLVLVDAPTVGPEGARRLQRVTALCEARLSSVLSDSDFDRACPTASPVDGLLTSRPTVYPADTPLTPRPTGRSADSPLTASPTGRSTDTPPTPRPTGHSADSPLTACPSARSGALPLPVVRAIVGGLRRATSARLRDGGTAELGPLTEEMVKWALLFSSPAVAALRPRLCANPPFPETATLEPQACGGEGTRARLLRSAIDLRVREGKQEEFSSLRIADGARLPVETFIELFPGPEACYLEALDVLGDEVLQLVADPGLVSARWPDAVCRTVARVLAHLASSPARLRTLAVKVFEAGPPAIANVGDLAYEVATLLTEGAPRRPRSGIAVEGLAGALWQILACEVLAGRGHRLPVLSEYVSYVVLTPFVGPEEAAEAIVRSRDAEASSSNGTYATHGAPATNGVRPAREAPAANGIHRTDGVHGTNGAHAANGTHTTNGTRGARAINGTHAVNDTPSSTGAHGTHATNGTNGTNGASPPRRTTGAWRSAARRSA
jgi:AcrR family transcriptional regulator